MGSSSYNIFETKKNRRRALNFHEIFVYLLDTTTIFVWKPSFPVPQMLSRSFLRNASALQRKSLLNTQLRSASLTPEERLKYISTPPYVLPFPLHKKLVAPAMTYISGEEMTRYTMELILEQWIRPHVDISKWEFFDLSCKSRDATNDKVLHDAVASGARMCAIFKEPTITPSAVQVKEMGLKKVLLLIPVLAVSRSTTVTHTNLSFLSHHSHITDHHPSLTSYKHHECTYQAWGSPNGAMRRGWNGITISRDTIHIEGVKLGK